MPDSTAVPAAPEVKSGWKTTELWISMFLLGGLGFIADQALPLIQTIFSNPSLPPWAALAAPLVVAVLGWASKGIHAEYVKSRVALKLPAAPEADVSAAVAAGAAAANATNDKILALLNK